MLIGSYAQPKPGPLQGISLIMQMRGSLNPFAGYEEKGLDRLRERWRSHQHNYAEAANQLQRRKGKVGHGGPILQVGDFVIDQQ